MVIVKKNKVFYSIASGIGNPVVYVGSKTGRDGIHGASMASASFDDKIEEKKPTVQVGDPFTEKLLMEACLELMKDDGFDPNNDYVRVGVKSGGCSGLSYELKFDKAQVESDKLFEDNGVKIIVDAKSFLYLIGTTLEYSGGLNGSGFVFENPNANRTCGCGESFSL